MSFQYYFANTDPLAVWLFKDTTSLSSVIILPYLYDFAIPNLGIIFVSSKQK